MSKQVTFTKQVEMLKALGDETRLLILSMLYQRDCCVCEVAYGLDKTQPSVSQHLRKLKQADLISERKQGSWVFYSLRRDIPQWVFALLDTLQSPDHVFIRIQESEINLPCPSAYK